VSPGRRQPEALAFIGDVHLDGGDPAVGEFSALLERLSLKGRRIVLMGDLFNLWVARPEFERPHHREIVDRLVSIRRRGTVVRYLEGNRDYRVGDGHAGSAFDDATDGGIEEAFGGVRAFAIHGDLANPSDLQYRAWRSISRSRAMWALFNLLPRGRRGRFAESLERRMRGTNLAYKRAFPEPEVRRYAATFVARGYDLVVLGHFHVEKSLEVEAGARRGRVCVLPEWKEHRRHLEIDRRGVVSFVDSGRGDGVSS
jgi:UDP-2,3-diacylglucosamine pyrophosphatase LpxH